METMDQLQQPSSSPSPPSPPLSTSDRIECNREASKKSLQRNVSLMLETLLAAVDEVPQQQQQQQQNGSGEAVPFDIIASAATVEGSTSDSDVQKQQNNANLIEFLRTTKLRLYEQVDNLVNEVHNSVLVMVTGEGCGTDISGTGSGTEGTGLGTEGTKKTYRKWPRGPLAATPIIPNSNTRTYSKVTRVKNFVPPLPLLCYSSSSTSGTDQQQQSQRKSVIIKTDPYQHSHSHSTSHNYDLTLDDDISVANLIPEVQIDVQEHDNVKMSADLNDGDQIDGYGDQAYGDQSGLDGDNDGGNVAQEMDQREDNNSANLDDSSELVAVDDENQQSIEQQQQQPPKPSSPTELAVPPGLAQRIEQAKADEEERELEEATQAGSKQPTRRSTRTLIVLVNPNADNGEDDDEEEEQLEELNEDEFLTEDEDPEEEEEGSGDGTEVQEPKAKRVLKKKKKTKNQSEEEYENEASTDAGEGEDDLEEPTPGPSTSQKRTRKATTKAPRKPRKQNENATKKKSKPGAKPKPKAKAPPKAPKPKKAAKPPGRRSKHITPEQAELLKKGSRTFYQCLHCEKQFKRKDYLDHHLLNHNGIHLHKCEYCERTFTMKAHLVDHRMTHTGEKRHQCQYCDRQFAKTCNYKRHLRLHLDQRPYICTWPGCQYRSGNRSDVFKHIRARHFRVPRYIKDQHDRNITDQRDARMYFQELQIDDPIQMAASLHQQMNQHLNDEGIEDREMVEAEVPEDMDQVPEPMEDHNQQQPIDVDPNLAQLQNGGGVPLIEPIDILATLVPDMQ